MERAYNRQQLVMIKWMISSSSAAGDVVTEYLIFRQ
jgi:hypothetical protein